MIGRIKEILIGSPLPTQLLKHERLDNVRALAAFSPDALSSIAYANQEIYLGLVVAGAAGLALAFPIGLVITLLLAIVAFSYLQTIHGYPSGGGSYVAARENLGTIVGLVTAAALMMGYILTAAVSITAGVAAIASAFPELWPYRVSLSLIFLLLITLINLRGARETGTIMAIPVYLFLSIYLPMLIYGLYISVRNGQAFPIMPLGLDTQPVTLYLLLRTFSAGCTALTGIEAISNGVPSFQPPESKNAGRTLIIMAILMVILFLGSISLTQYLGILPGPDETILSALAHRILGRGAAYFSIQAATMLILVVAANTSFSGYPRLASVLAKDGFLPRQLTGLGDRLVHANGILLLSLAAGLLIVLFGGDTHALVPLFAVGVFSAFTLSQAGMVVHWWRERGRRWWLKAAVNGLGALATGTTVIVIGASKFLEGAWITIGLVPLLVATFMHIHAHYEEVANELSMGGSSCSLQMMPSPRLIIPISGVHRGVVQAVAFAESITDDLKAVYVEVDPGAGQAILEKWKRYWPEIPLAIVPSPYRSIVGPLLDFLDEEDRQHHDGQLAIIVLPEIVPARWWHGILHNQTAWLLKAAFLYRRRRLGFTRVIIDVPFHLRK